MRKISLVMVTVAVLTLPFASPAAAQASCSTTNPGTFIYSVKFLCGLQVVPSNPSTVPNEPPVKPGNYATSVNVHNYHSANVASFCKKAVIALPEGSAARGTVSPFVTDTLDFNQAEEIDCSDIVTLLHPTLPTPPPFIKGFVEMLSNVQLSVAAVYTSQGCAPPSITNKCPKLGELALEVVPQQPLPGP